MSFDVLVFIAVLIMSGLGALTSKYFFGETMLSMIMFFLFTLLYFIPIVMLPLTIYYKIIKKEEVKQDAN